MKQRILYVEDEQILGQLVKEALEKNGFDVLHVLSGSDAIAAFRKYQPHLCLLDIMLPGEDGCQIAEQVRLTDKKVPLIFLTAKVQVASLSRAFEAGGNDYIRKPFNMEELLLRINNWMAVRYGAPDTPDVHKQSVGQFTFEPLKQILSHGEEVVRLSHKEAELLAVLLSHKNTIISRDHVLQQVWGNCTIYNSRILDVYIARMRRYFAADKHIQIITLRGVGYRFLC